MVTHNPTNTEAHTAKRHDWIAEAAYYLAERRGFQGGCPIEDWLYAERVFDQHDAQGLPSPRMALVFLDRRSTDEGAGG